MLFPLSLLNPAGAIRRASEWPRARRWQQLVERVNALEPRAMALTDAALRSTSLDLRWRAKAGEPLSRLLPEAFALVREAGRRFLGMRHYDVQLYAGCALYDGSIAEMQTGEGKTLMATLPAYLGALEGRGVHVATVNDYLAARDSDLMRPLFERLGMTVGCIQSGRPPEARRPQYACDITYGTAQEFAFDFLKDRIARAREQGGGEAFPSLFGESENASAGIQRGHHFAIIDEADSVLIDEAKTPLVISAPADNPSTLEVAACTWAAGIAPQLVEDEDFSLDPQRQRLELTAKGRATIRRMSLPPALRTLRFDEITRHAERALRALHLFHRDRQYIIEDGKIVIVDEYTGRLMPERKWRDGLHQAIEAKEGLTITGEMRQAAATTIQNYFTRYARLAGMTGTALTTRDEMRRVYGVRVVKIPTNRPPQRIRLPDRIYPDAATRWQAVVEEVAARHEKGQPVLIGTRSVDKSELLSRLLTERGIPHATLNARKHAEEAGIIAQAGLCAAVTIATNMAGRGVDIRLGPGAAERGGLHVLGTERHDSVRVDRQLEGRAGRQGDPGSTQFLLSLEDDLLRALPPSTFRRLQRQIGSHSLNQKTLRRLFRFAQERVERQHYRQRLQLLRYERRRNEAQQTMGFDPVLYAVN